MTRSVHLLDIERDNSLRPDVERLARLSAESQSLKHPITAWEKIRESSDQVYLLKENDFVTGYVRLGQRTLYLSPDPVSVELQPFSVYCVLDFFIQDQRRGNGIFLMQKILTSSPNLSPEKLAFDRPSAKLVPFLRKHFGLLDLVEQPNKFVISRQFFSLYKFFIHQ